MTICSVPDCGHVHQARGFCGTHYYRWQRYGDPLVLASQFHTPRCKQECSVGDCTERANACRGLCKKHYSRWKRHGDPTKRISGLERQSYRNGKHFNNKGDDVGYHAVHRRLKHSRGRAADHPCIDCGQQACDWSYNYSAVDERVWNNLPFSVDMEDYSPRCKSCHVKQDETFGNRRYANT